MKGNPRRISLSNQEEKTELLPQEVVVVKCKHREAMLWPLRCGGQHTLDKDIQSATYIRVSKSADIRTLMDLLREYGQHKKECTVETVGCACGFSSRISVLVPPSTPISQPKCVKCVKCGHLVAYFRNGFCYRDIGLSKDGLKICLCKCEFSLSPERPKD